MKHRIKATVNSRDLSRATQRFIAAKGADASDVIIKVGSGICADLQLATPVDTGRARAGWSPMLLRYGGARLTEGPDGKAVAEGRALGRVAFDGDKRDAAGKFQEHSPNPTLTVTNGVGYLPDLNAGKSTQARPGFIEHVLERWTRHLYREARGG